MFRAALLAEERFIERANLRHFRESPCVVDRILTHFFLLHSRSDRRLATNSFAFLADAVHMLTDVGGLGLALFATWMSAKLATPSGTFGYSAARGRVYAAYRA